jgi:transcriptional regulator of arginine metabolism
MENVYRRTQIVDLLRTEEVETQDDLRRKLARRGIHVTQATVSRDIEELGLVKTRTGYRLPDATEPMAPPQPTLAVVLKEFLTEVRQAANLVVIKTRPGNAHSVAVALDANPWEIPGKRSSAPWRVTTPFSSPLPARARREPFAREFGRCWRVEGKEGIRG